MHRDDPPQRSLDRPVRRPTTMYCAGRAGRELLLNGAPRIGRIKSDTGLVLGFIPLLCISLLVRLNFRQPLLSIELMA